LYQGRGRASPLLKEVSSIAINFRREPIYISEEKLKEPRYSKYRFFITRLPALRKLRDLYIGRVIHRSEEQWRNDVMDLLKFNVEAERNDARWRE